MNPYQLKRDADIERNRLRLQALGVGIAVQKLSIKKKPKAKRKVKVKGAEPFRKSTRAVINESLAEDSLVPACLLLSQRLPSLNPSRVPRETMPGVKRKPYSVEWLAELKFCDDESTARALPWHKAFIRQPELKGS